ncbi:hypothetical protein ACFVKB_21980 [Rhodococcus sp. NPDC127530]|uniref:hypothetical protein n=1 Tax=unclassified Rhodococcus (in: high G+C Gram-positive bacteria) TaxID=192944 RepID=UPI00363F65D2
MLLKENRNGATADPAQLAAEVPATQQPAEPEKKPSNKPTTVYIAPDVLKQARLAFKATQSAEADRNWSHFVEKALADATQRRAAQHNDGNEFVGEDKPLPPGRPLADD